VLAFENCLKRLGSSLFSRQAAAIRGVPLASGAKAMLMDRGEGTSPRHALVVMSASRKVSWKVWGVFVAGC
jgi:prolyl-tRNA editing enzyme YbaK/EbsC (Cys-tRNA(Pro) deacylase)